MELEHMGENERWKTKKLVAIYLSIAITGETREQPGA